MHVCVLSQCVHFTTEIVCMFSLSGVLRCTVGVCGCVWRGGVKEWHISLMLNVASDVKYVPGVE